MLPAPGVIRGEVRMNYNPHPAQRQFHNSNARFRIAACGRRFGKTLMGLVDAGKFARSNPNSIVWWVDPTYQFAKRAYRLLKHATRASLLEGHKGYSDSELILYYKNGARIEFHSAEIPDNLRGEGIWALYVNEASLISIDAWGALRPALSDRRARAAFFFTPKGMGHWTFTLWNKGRDEHYNYASKGALGSYHAFHFPSTANPYLDAAEIEEARELLPADVFEQEYLAVWKEDSAGVFKNVDKICVGTPLLGPVDGVMYGAGLDLAKTQDFTVFSVFDLYRKVQVSLYRTNALSYSKQEKIVMDLCRKWRIQRLNVDATGVGEPVCDALAESMQHAGYPAPINVLNRFKFTGDSKQALVEGMVVDFEQEKCRLLDDETQKNELRAFQYVLSPSRKIKYAAPDGMHDDIVIADGLGLQLTHDPALWGVPGGRMPTVNARGW